ncbi:MAG TPA: site-2 protease family protein [Candidatus Polarisedimenticolaceae bacterium]|nr:site-2 protease family protein [Candidatus Polarisedimenticolaceae bacterium]
MSDPEQKRIDNLRAVLAGTTRTEPQAQPQEAGGHRGRNTVLGGIGAALALILGKFKFLALLGGLLKFKTLGSMLLSIGLYAVDWGLPFACGFVLLILVHELGHVVALRREGIPAGAPVFIPFVGAFIAMQGRPRDAYVEAKVAIGGPLLGSLAAWATLAAGLAAGQGLLVTLGHAAILLNLFNLIPVSPLDGGRIAGAFSRGFWFAGYALGIAALVLTRSPLLLIVLAVGLITLWQRLRHPVPGYDAIPRAQRLAMGLAYAALVVGLCLTLPIGLETHPTTVG